MCVWMSSIASGVHPLVRQVERALGQAIYLRSPQPTTVSPRLLSQVLRVGTTLRPSHGCVFSPAKTTPPTDAHIHQHSTSQRRSLIAQKRHRVAMLHFSTYHQCGVVIFLLRAVFFQAWGRTHAPRQPPSFRCLTRYGPLPPCLFPTHMQTRSSILHPLAQRRSIRRVAVTLSSCWLSVCP